MKVSPANGKTELFLKKPKERREVIFYNFAIDTNKTGAFSDFLFVISKLEGLKFPYFLRRKTS